MQEANIENFLKRCVEDKGGLCLKFNSSSMRGLPDRIIVLPGGRIVFSEVKAPKQKPRPEQLRVHEQLKRLGAEVFVIDSKEKVKEVLYEICTAQVPENGN